MAHGLNRQFHPLEITKSDERLCSARTHAPSRQQPAHAPNMQMPARTKRQARTGVAQQATHAATLQRQQLPDRSAGAIGYWMIWLLRYTQRPLCALPLRAPYQTGLVLAAGKRLVRMPAHGPVISVHFYAWLGMPVLPGSLLPLAQPHPSTAPFDQPRGLLLSCTQATSPLLLQRHSFAEHAFARLAHMAASSACACLTCAIIGTILTLLLQ